MSRSEQTKEYPIGNSLDGFRTTFTSLCKGTKISAPCTTDTLGQFGREDLQNLTLPLLVALQSHPISGLLPSINGRGPLRSDLLRLISAVTSDDFDLSRIKPLLKSALSDEPDDSLWHQVQRAVTEPTPPPRPVASSISQTPWLRNTSSFPNSSEHRKYVDVILKEELGPMYVGIPNFWDTYFSGVADLEVASEAFFKQCLTGTSLRFQDGWTGWPMEAKQDDVLAWFIDFCESLAAFAESWTSVPRQRKILAMPNKPIDSSIGKRKMDIGIVSDSLSLQNKTCHWSQILVPGELKSNPSADKPSEAWLDLGRYAREVLAAQDARRFVLSFSICGSLMRVWVFDRVGGIAFEQYDINEDGFRFVFTTLGCLWMKEDDLGFDPTILTAKHERFIEIKRNDSMERIFLDEVMLRVRCIAGRATTCWRAHLDKSPEMRLVIKDSWQYPECDEEGDLLREVMDKGVINVARYYHHETVQVRQLDDDIRNNVRQGLDIATATNWLERSAHQSRPTRYTPRRSRTSTSTIGKRPSSQTDSSLPPNKRSCSSSPTKITSVLPNRIHRRIVIRDYGKPIYMASSRSALLSALEGCIKGHESLYKAGILHRDISINNLMINEDRSNPSWPSFLIDLDLAIREPRGNASGAKGKTGTRAFMAIGALLGEQHSFMHDLESFFWVLFWICIHYGAEGQLVGAVGFDDWNYDHDDRLVASKKGLIDDEEDFLQQAGKNFSSYYQPLIPWVNRLRRKVFPNGGRWKRLEPELYSSMTMILREAREDEERRVADNENDS
ncbi:hypothetical protein M406DRAFT_263277 [Cryphonectria parasitica EP155]|uniref:non-specific serine/threonine protein kinase n=1 Tax=Cryphonectria parasitica (strain ATCC 38755 / EP155) TaxID=660469 RepID=A0A9P5CLV5_CRYP1|nr:uncharacterized protein M406DRAFT_263277 [Cryphonectria parasitica EP155]KAF3762441.1 hypothetical protein M406DRAFT_263277 [Cryphonectria parasitica EP155]